MKVKGSKVLKLSVTLNMIYEYIYKLLRGRTWLYVNIVLFNIIFDILLQIVAKIKQICYQIGKNEFILILISKTRCISG